MLYDKMKFDISDEVLALGLRGVYFNMENIHNKKSDSEFDEIVKQTLKDTALSLTEEKIEENAAINGFRRLHTSVGRSNRKNISSSESLAYYFLKTGQLPRINLLVDIYNLVSLKTFLAIGAHDLAAVTGNIHLKMTEGTEKYMPLGSGEFKEVMPGEYAYIDEANDIICRMEVKQVEKTKVTEQTEACFFIVQGNMETSSAYLMTAAKELIHLIKKFCGGEENFLYASQE